TQAVIDAADVDPADPLHHPADDLAMLRGHQEVDVVGHQHVGMYVAAMAAGMLVQKREIELAVAVFEEAGLPAMSALHDVLGDAWGTESGGTGHGGLRLVTSPVSPAPDNAATASPPAPWSENHHRGQSRGSDPGVGVKGLTPGWAYNPRPFPG